MSVSIVYMITDLSTGGSEQALARLLARIDRSRYAPVVICLKNADTPIGREISALGIPLIDVGFTNAARIDALQRIHAALKKARPSIVHAWLFHAVVAARVFGRMTGVPILISSRRNINLGSPFRETVNRMTNRFDDRVTAVSEAARRVEIDRGGARPDRVVVIPNGVDIDEFPAVTPERRAAARKALCVPHDTRLVATVGRLHPSKGTRDFIAAAARILEKIPGARFLVIGDGEEREPLGHLARRLRIDARVSFLGERRDLPALLPAFDLFVLPSRQEGMPNALLEAMASGLPVVVTAAGGSAEIVEDGVSGLLVAPGDVDALAHAAVSILNDSQRAVSFGANARRRVADRFSIRTTVSLTEKLYEAILLEKLDLRFVAGRGWIGA